MPNRSDSAFTHDIPYPLKADDTLAFLHMYKAAGGSFTRVVKRPFADERTLLCHSEGELTNITPKQLAEYEYIHGHVGYALMDYFAPAHRPVWVTMIRNPIDRIISHYYFKRQTHDTLVEKGRGHNTELRFIMSNTFDDFVRSRFAGANNLQTRALLLGRGETWRKEKRSHEEIIAILKDRILNECAFIGLTDRFQDSLYLFYYTFAWRPFDLESDKRFHVTQKRPKSADLPPETLRAIQEKNQLDMALYEFAAELFEARYQTMLADLSQNYGDGNLEHAAENIEALLHQHFMKHAVARWPEREVVELNFDDPLLDNPQFAEGWYKSGKKTRWTGPEPQSTIFLNLSKGRDLQADIHIRRAVHQDVMDSFQLEVNGHSITVEPFALNNRTVFSGIIPQHVLQSSAYLAEIVLKVSHTQASEGKDARLLGLSFHAMMIAPQQEEPESDQEEVTHELEG